MKKLMLTLALVWTMAGCGKPSARPLDARLQRQADLIPAKDLNALWMASSAGATNGNEVVSRFAWWVNSNTVATLAKEGPSELRRKLDTLARGTHRHDFTEAQLRDALKLKGFPDGR